MARSRKTPAPYETNPTDTRYLVLRGGGWGSRGPSWVRAASRDTDVPADRDNDFGFRCALRGCRQPVGKVQP